MSDYGDILDRERPPHGDHPPMPRADRAKQFMPFATLRGYGDMITDRGILPEVRPEEDDDANAGLNAQFGRLQSLLEAGERPRITVSWYETDQSLRLKLRREEGRVERLSIPERTLRFSGRTVSLDDVRELTLGEGEESG